MQPGPVQILPDVGCFGQVLGCAIVRGEVSAGVHRQRVAYITRRAGKSVFGQSGPRGAKAENHMALNIA